MRWPIRTMRCLGCLAVVVCVIAAGCSAPNSVLIERADAAVANSQPLRAEAFLVRAMAHDQTDWRVYERFGQLRLADHRALDAQVYFEQALTLRPDHPETGQIIESLAESLLMQGKYDAMGQVLAARASHTGQEVDYLRQGRFLTRIGDVDAAMLAYRKAAAVAEPGDADPMLAIAALYESTGDNANALLYLRYAYYQQPANLFIADELRRHGMVPGPTAGLEPPTQ